MTKQFITADQLLKDAFSLAMQILDSGFKPSFIVGVWRGGAPIGIAVQELLDVCGVKTDHIAVRTSSYTGIDQRDKQVRVHGLGYVIDEMRACERLLIVDDVHDSGLSVAEIIKQIGERCGSNTPSDIKVATVYYKPGKSLVATAPDYFVHETDKWLVFPHELQGLTERELIDDKPCIGPIKARLLDYLQR